VQIKDSILELFESELSLTCFDIANLLSVDVNYVLKVVYEVFGNYHCDFSDLYLVPSIDLKGCFYLFSGFGEKKLEIENNLITNNPSLSEKELIFLSKNYNIYIEETRTPFHLEL